MCLIVVAYRVDPRWPLIVLANRDEYHARPAESLAVWDGIVPIAAGRDLKAGGTWMGALPDGRFAAVTNARVPGGSRARPRSRGSIPFDALVAMAAGETLPGGQWLPLELDHYAPFGLLIGGRQALAHQSNWFDSEGELDPGIHVLSNGPMNARWPKAVRLSEGLQALLEANEVDLDGLFMLLRQEQVDPALPLPDTGVGAELERRLAPPFIRDPIYGTRASTILRVSSDSGVELCERRFDPGGDPAGQCLLRGDGTCWR